MVVLCCGDDGGVSSSRFTVTTVGVRAAPRAPLACRPTTGAAVGVGDVCEDWAAVRAAAAVARRDSAATAAGVRLLPLRLSEWRLPGAADPNTLGCAVVGSAFAMGRRGVRCGPKGVGAPSATMAEKRLLAAASRADSDLSSRAIRSGEGTLRHTPGFKWLTTYSEPRHTMAMSRTL